MEKDRKVEHTVVSKNIASTGENAVHIETNLVKSLKRECSVDTRAIEIDGEKIYYLSAGKGKKDIIMIHGAGLSSAKDFAAFICDISEEYRVVVPDLPGFGMNSGIKPDYTIDYYVEFIDKFVKATKLEKPAIIAQSMGGVMAIKWALKNQGDVEKLVLVNSYGMIKKFPDHKLYYFGFCIPFIGDASLKLMLKTSWFRKYLLGIFIQEGTTIDNEKLKNFGSERGFDRLNVTLKILRDELRFNSLKSYVADAFKDMKFPTMVIHGEQDPLFSKETAEKAAKSIPNYKEGISKFEVLKKQKHNLNESGMKRAERLAIAFLLRHVQGHDS